MIAVRKNGRWVSRALDGFVAGLDIEADGVVEAVFGFCLDRISIDRVAVNVKAALFDKVKERSARCKTRFPVLSCC